MVARLNVDGAWEPEVATLTDPEPINTSKLVLDARGGFAVAGWTEVREMVNWTPVVSIYESGAWQPATLVDSSIRGAHEIDVAISSDGVATVSWSVRMTGGQQTDLWVSQRLTSGWSAPAQLAALSGNRSLLPRVVAETDTTATVCWTDRSQPGNPISCAPVVDGVPQASTTMPVSVGPGGQETLFDLVHDPASSELTLTWARAETFEGDATWLIANRGSDGVWGAPTELLPEGPDGVDGGRAGVAVGAGGHLVAAIRRGSNEDSQVWATWKPPGGAWATPTRIDVVPSELLWGPSIAVDRRGRAMVAWQGWADEGEWIRAVRFRPDVGFMEEETIDGGGTLNRLPAVLVELSGRVLLFFEDDDAELLYEAAFE